MSIPLFVVDAFTDTPFAGNPAGVCVLEYWPSDGWLQNVGREMNLAETAFLVRRTETHFDLRWFTPAVEVALCGHATLGAAHALWENNLAPRQPLNFHTHSGVLIATPTGNEIELDFPAKPSTPCDPPEGLLDSLGLAAVSVGRNDFDYIVEVSTEEAVRGAQPDFARLGKVNCRGVIVTARAAGYDFVSRFFAPAVGINEDPVTGSAHCCLAEFWGEKLGKSEMTGFQASPRGGVVRVVRVNGRVKLIGQAVLMTRGVLLAPPE
jgi:predicted PhzF superfamily epimerase YddE/YHI9